ncbi:hypothetical protein BHE74_00025046 [Ensete ventricosum]|nr:hypothetical protein BHE74_00025046 [Ensete ventricosum]
MGSEAQCSAARFQCLHAQGIENSTHLPLTDSSSGTSNRALEGREGIDRCPSQSSHCLPFFLGISAVWPFFYTRTNPRLDLRQ